MSSDRSTADRRFALPEGTLPVGGALIIAGLATYSFFIVGKLALGGDAEFEPIVSMWFLTFSLAPGFFLPLEQELGRAVSSRRARGEGGRPVVRRVATLGAIITSIVLVALLTASPLIATNFFDGDWWMVAALVASFAAYAPAHVARGIAAGTGRFRSYALIIGSDGVVRIVLCLILAGIGIKAAGPYGFAVALAPLVPVAIVWSRGQLRTDDGPPAPWSEVTQNLGWLLCGTVCSAALLNAGPVAAAILAEESQSDLVTRFGYGVLLARIPLFLFQAVQAALLPRLARLAARGEFDEFRSGLRKLLILVAGVGVAGTLGAFVLGPFAVELMYDAELSGRTLAMLALSSSLYMACIATAQAVIALHGHAAVALGWAIGVVAFVLGTWLSSDGVFRRIEIGLVVSSAVALGCFSFALRQRLAAGVQPTPESVLDALTELPYEG